MMVDVAGSDYGHLGELFGGGRIETRPNRYQTGWTGKASRVGADRLVDFLHTGRPYSFGTGDEGVGAIASSIAATGLRMGRLQAFQLVDRSHRYGSSQGSVLLLRIRLWLLLLLLWLLRWSIDCRWIVADCRTIASGCSVVAAAIGLNIIAIGSVACAPWPLVGLVLLFDR